MSDLKLVKQRKDNDCVIAAIATATRNTYEAVYNIFPKDKGVSHWEEKIIFARLGYLMLPVPFETDILSPGHIYTITVPSLNFEGKNHMIIIDYRNDFIIFDPEEGTGKKYYTYKNLVSWSNTSIIIDVFDDNVFNLKL